MRQFQFRGWIVAFCLASTAVPALGAVPLEGFLPLFGLGLSNEFQDSTLPQNATTFFLAQKRNAPGGLPLGQGSSAYYDLALFDTGAATHILTPQAYIGFDILAEGFDGTNFQTVGGATGFIDLQISDPLGVYVAGLSQRTSSGSQLVMNRPQMRGQSSFAVLSGPAQWTLPNIVGLPMAAQHRVTIRNSNPQIFEHQGRTVRTPDLQLSDLGLGGGGITRRAPLRLRPGLGFVTGPLYIQNLDFQTLVLHENPLSPSIIENGALFIEVDINNAGMGLDDTEFLFDTGASLTVVSELTAVRLGFDPILDTPDFVLQVEGSGGIANNVPGFYVDQLRIDTIGGSFSVSNVPIAVLDITNPNDPGNIVDGILGMNVFQGRDLVIDANPSIGGGGASPSLYIGDPVTQGHAWGTTAVSGDWQVAGSWNAAGVPATLWDATVRNVRGSNQEAFLSVNSTVFRATISGTAAAEMKVRIPTGRTLTTFADVRVEQGGRLELNGGSLNAQFVHLLDDGILSGRGSIFVGSGPLNGNVKNQSGLISPGGDAVGPVGTLAITGDLANGPAGTMAFDLGGTIAGTGYDQVTVTRSAFLDGTLSVGLINPGTFNPNIGDIFTLITASGGVQGSFENLLLPTNFSWSVTYTSTAVRLQVAGVGLLGDFDRNGQLNCVDIDQLTGAVASGNTLSVFDLNADGLVNLGDVNKWVLELKGTLLGDANLDDVVDGSDFGVWNANKFTASSAWCQGDFNADGQIDGSDFGTWNTNKFQTADGTHMIPEPLPIAWAATVSFLAGLFRRKREH